MKRTFLFAATHNVHKSSICLAIYLILLISLFSCAPPLIKAIQKNDTEKISKLIDYSANINVTDKNGRTPLHYAVEQGNTELVSHLIDHGANVNIDNSSYGLKPIHISCDRNNLEITRLLLSKGAKVNVTMSKYNQFTPLMFAAKNNNLDMVKLLVEHGAEINTYAKLWENVFSPLVLATDAENLDMVKYLRENGADLVTNELGITRSLQHAVYNGYPGISAYLLDQKANDSKSLCLTIATTNNHLEVVRVLIEHGYNVNTINPHTGETPIFIAASRGYNKIVRFLTENGANVNQPDLEELTPIFYAAFNCQDTIVDYLIEMGADPSFNTDAFPEDDKEKYYDLKLVTGFIDKIMAKRYTDDGKEEKAEGTYQEAIAKLETARRGYEKLFNKSAGKEFWAGMGNTLAGVVSETNYNYQYSMIPRSEYYRLIGDPYETFNSQQYTDLKQYYQGQMRKAAHQITFCNQEINELTNKKKQ